MAPPWSRKPAALPPQRKREIRSGDKYEVSSPTGRAKCRGCHKKIQLGTRRIGREVYSEEIGWYHKYYHVKCMPTRLKRRLKFPGGGGPSIRDELKRQKEEKKNNERRLHDRQDLREELKTLRSLFAEKLHCGVTKIFDDKTLDDLTIKMPKNEHEMFEVWGIGEARYKNFGEPILEVIRHYLKLCAERESAEESEKVVAAEEKALVATVEPDSDDSNTVVIGETLSCEEIVQRKFEHAASNGYIITVDD